MERRAPSPGPLNGKYGEEGRLEGVLRSGTTGRGFLHAHFECRGKVAKERDERTNERARRETSAATRVRVRGRVPALAREGRSRRRARD